MKKFNSEDSKFIRINEESYKKLLYEVKRR